MQVVSSSFLSLHHELLRQGLLPFHRPLVANGSFESPRNHVSALPRPILPHNEFSNVYRVSELILVNEGIHHGRVVHGHKHSVWSLRLLRDVPRLTLILTALWLLLAIHQLECFLTTQFR